MKLITTIIAAILIAQSSLAQDQTSQLPQQTDDQQKPQVDPLISKLKLKSSFENNVETKAKIIADINKHSYFTGSFVVLCDLGPYFIAVNGFNLATFNGGKDCDGMGMLNKRPIEPMAIKAINILQTESTLESYYAKTIIELKDQPIISKKPVKYYVCSSDEAGYPSGDDDFVFNDNPKRFHSCLTDIDTPKLYKKLRSITQYKLERRRIMAKGLTVPEVLFLNGDTPTNTSESNNFKTSIYLMWYDKFVFRFRNGKLESWSNF